MSSTGHDSPQALLDRYRETQDPDDLFAAFGSATDALAATAQECPEYVSRVRMLADVMFVYFDLTGGFSVIDCAVEMRRREIAFTGRDDSAGAWAIRHPDWDGGTFSRALRDDAWTLHHPDGRRSQVWKDWTAWNGEGWPMGWQVRRPDSVVIELPEEQWGDSWGHDPAGAPQTSAEPELPPVEALLGHAARLRERFLQTGDADTLEESLRVARAAVERTSAGEPLRSIALDTAAASAQDWFGLTGDLDALREAARYAHLALDDSQLHEVNRGTVLNTLAAVHQRLYAATGDQAELGQAIEVGRQAAAAARDPDGWAISAINLVAALDDWFGITAEPSALDDAIDLARRVVDETPDEHPRKPGRLNTYGNVLMTRFESEGQTATLDDVISVRREAMHLADPDEVDYASILNNLGNALHARFRLTGDREALREAVELRKEAVVRTPPGSVSRLAHLKNLVTALDEWRTESGDQSADAERERIGQEIREIDPNWPEPPIKETIMSGVPRELAYAFAGGTKWKKAFAEIADDSPIALAGMAEWVRVTTFERASDRVYYMVTARGLHVGQQGQGGGFFGGGSYVDHFLPREEIIGLDTDFTDVIQFDARDDSRVILCLDDVFSQLGQGGMVHMPAVAQMEALAESLGWRYDRQPARD
jgi:hypothetical protein